MSRFVPGAGWTYDQYLQMKSFEDGIRWEISEKALAVGGSLDALKAQGVRIETAIGAEGEATREALTTGLAQVSEGISRGIEQVDRSLDRIEDTLQAGFVRLHFDLKDVRSSLTEMSARFDYGFTELSNRLGAINDTLDELKQLAKNPEQTWSFEQYEIAREAFERGLFEEALVYVTRAIDGHQSHTGYMLEHRFHHFLGALRLGDHRNRSPEIIDLALAEKAFVNASRYAQVTYPKDAARALCHAGHAAYWQGNVEKALEHTRKALELYDELPQARFQLAKYTFRAGDGEKGLNFLDRAIELDRLYAVRCFDAEEIEFRPFEAQIVERLESAGARHRTLATEWARRTASRADQIASEMKAARARLQSSVSGEAGALVPSEQAIVTHADASRKHAGRAATPLPFIDSMALWDEAQAQSLELWRRVNTAKDGVRTSIGGLGTRAFAPRIETARTIPVADVTKGEVRKEGLGQLLGGIALFFGTLTVLGAMLQGAKGSKAEPILAGIALVPLGFAVWLASKGWKKLSDPIMHDDAIVARRRQEAEAANAAEKEAVERRNAAARADATRNASSAKPILEGLLAKLDAI